MPNDALQPVVMLCDQNLQHVAYLHIFYPAGPKHVTKPFDAFQPPILLCDKLAAFAISSDFSPVVKIHTVQSLEHVLFLPMESMVLTNQRRGEKVDWRKAQQNARLFNLNIFCLLLHKFHSCSDACCSVQINAVLNSCPKTFVSFLSQNYFVTCLFVFKSIRFTHAWLHL